MIGRLSLLALVLSSFATSTFAQHLGLIHLQAFHSGMSAFPPIVDATTDGYGNSYIAGQFYLPGGNEFDFDPTSAVNILQAQSGHLVYLVKYNSLDELQWAYMFDAESCGELKVVNDKVLISLNEIGGDSVDLDPTNGLDIHYAVRSTVTSLSLSGNYLSSFVLSQMYGPPSLDYSRIYDFAFDEADNFYIVGSADSVIDFNPAADTTHVPQPGAYIAKYNAGGNLLWLRPLPCYSYPGSALLFSISFTPAGKLLVGGNFGHKIWFTSTTFCPPSGNLWGHLALFFASYDTAGTFEWYKAIDPSADNNSYYNVEQDASGFIYVFAKLSGTTTDLDPNGGVIHPERPGFTVIKYTPFGEYIWDIPGAGISSGAGFHLFPDGTCIVGGNYENDTVDIDPGPGMALLVPTPNSTGYSKGTYYAEYNAYGSLNWYESIINEGSLRKFSYDTSSNSLFTITSCNDTVDYDFGSGIDTVQGDGSVFATYLYKPNQIKGRVFADLNSSGLFDTGDEPVSNQTLQASSIPDTTIYTSFYHTDTAGFYTSYVSEGVYQIKPVAVPPYFQSMPDSLVVGFPDPFSGVVTNYDFALSPIGTVNDLVIMFVAVHPAQPGFTSGYKIAYTNSGTTVLSGNVVLSIDSASQFISSFPDPDGIVGLQHSWNFYDLAPFETRYIDVVLKTNIAVSLGAYLNHVVTVNSLASDFTPDDNIFSLFQPVVGSFDPNTKEVSPKWVLPQTTNTGPYLTYTVHFQNTGTYPTTFIDIFDTLHPPLDVASIQTLAASHPYTFNIVDGNVAKWSLNNVALVPADQDENESMGFIQFRIRTASNLNLGDEINNSAAIFFDYNQPVITETATTLVSTANNLLVPKFAFTASVYPNPSNSVFYLQLPYYIGEYKLECFDVNGRLVYIDFNDSESIAIKLLDSPSGFYTLRVTSNKYCLVDRLIVSSEK